MSSPVSLHPPLRAVQPISDTGHYSALVKRALQTKEDQIELGWPGASNDDLIDKVQRCPERRGSIVDPFSSCPEPYMSQFISINIYLVDRYHCWTTINSGQPSTLDYHQLWTTINSGLPSTLDYHQLWTTINSGQPSTLDYYQLWTTINSGQPSTLDYHQLWTTIKS
ncbi:hypothetical protein Bpfe_030868 [Biomphalaria pfeifferi]|uniref:Uncharacterized protein n=1 Tax=Biomphalaria pfeifferi TaxID=112525 RepID=A0AAD8ANV7_BIOPF|nr:hypothetical protein Bpfe_030868 [Biomphalaria pfeifferi]